MERILFLFKTNFNLFLVILMCLISVVLYFVDRRRFIKNQDKKEEKVAKYLSYIYFLGSIGAYIIIKITG